MTDKRFFKKINPLEDAEERVGRYLSKPLRDEILRTSADKLALLRQGGEETALRHHTEVKRAEELAFDRYSSLGQLHQDRALMEQKKIIDTKTAKKDFVPDVPFNVKNFTR